MRRCPQALYTAAGAPRGAGWPARIDPEPRDSHVRGSAARTSERVCCSAFAEVRPVKLSFGQQRAICLTLAQVLTVIIASIYKHWPRPALSELQLLLLQSSQWEWTVAPSPCWFCTMGSSSRVRTESVMETSANHSRHKIFQKIIFWGGVQGPTPQPRNRAYR